MVVQAVGFHYSVVGLMDVFVQPRKQAFVKVEMIVLVVMMIVEASWPFLSEIGYSVILANDIVLVDLKKAFLFVELVSVVQHCVAFVSRKLVAELIFVAVVLEFCKIED